MDRLTTVTVKVLVNKNLTGRCGLYCGACIIYRAYKDSEKLQKRIAEERTARGEDCKPEEIRCEGCQTVLVDGWNSKEWGRNCKIVKCLQGKKLDFCYECDTYPECKKFLVVSDSCLKHGESLTENLSRIEAGKVEEWLEEEDEKWRCQKCGNPISMHLGECHWCGAKPSRGAEA